LRVIWSEEAVADVTRIARHIAQDNPAAARRLARELLVAGDSLDVFPHRGRRGLSRSTRELVAVLPYVLVYRVGQDTVRILRVWHGAQNR
jgi:toxin ParE1/3/4